MPRKPDSCYLGKFEASFALQYLSQRAVTKTSATKPKLVSKLQQQFTTMRVNVNYPTHYFNRKGALSACEMIKRWQCISGIIIISFSLPRWRYAISNHLIYWWENTYSLSFQSVTDNIELGQVFSGYFGFPSILIPPTASPSSIINIIIRDR